MDTKNYLRRLGLESFDLPITAESLQNLQKNHLLRIPFENLDIHRKRLISLDTEKFYRKIVEEKRGGFCYELNGLFGALLNELGFSSRLLSARVAHGDGNFGAQYDHLAIMTTIRGEEFLTDVGFGDFSAGPLKFVLDAEQTDPTGVFRIEKHADDYFEVLKKTGENWTSEYIFQSRGRDLREFAEMCDFHQTSPESHFTQGRVCSLMLENGRKTLTDKKFIETRNGVKNETAVGSESEFDAILAREFEINFG